MLLVSPKIRRTAAHVLSLKRMSDQLSKRIQSFRPFRHPKLSLYPSNVAAMSGRRICSELWTCMYDHELASAAPLLYACCSHHLPPAASTGTGFAFPPPDGFSVSPGPLPAPNTSFVTCLELGGCDLRGAFPSLGNLLLRYCGSLGRRRNVNVVMWVSVSA